MSASEPYEFSEDGGTLRISPSTDIPGAAAIKTDCTIRVAAHRLAEVVAAMYEAAGQPVPDLPVIHDPESVAALAGDLADVVSDERPCNDMARDLLARGWRRDT